MSVPSLRIRNVNDAPVRPEKAFVLHWSAAPEEAAATLIALNDRWAIEGRDPTSTSGIFWTFGRYDRPWPERPVFGTIRAMTSDSTRRKLDVGPYVERYREQASLPLA